MYQLEIKEHAVEMIQEAYDWYIIQQQGLGDSFISVLESTFNRLASHPKYYSIIYKQYRQVKTPHFPFVVVFEIIQNSVIVYAVFHTSKAPTKKLRNLK